MEKRLLFEIPGDFEMKTRVLGLVPKDWLIDGELRAQKSAVAKGGILAETGLFFQRHNPPWIVGEVVGEKKKKPDLRGLRSRYFGFARFIEAGWHNFPAFDLAVEQAGVMVELGFEGGLHFYKECPRKTCRRHVLHCSMLFEFEVSIELKWDDACSATSGDVGLLLSELEMFAVREDEKKAAEALV